MRKSIGKRCFSFFIVFLLVFSMGISAYAETTYHKEKSGKIKAEKEISVNRGDNPSADFEEKIKKDVPAPSTGASPSGSPSSRTSPRCCT